MKLSFGNMTIEMNVFHICNQPWSDDDDIHEVHMIDSLIEEEFRETTCSDPLEVLLAHTKDECDGDDVEVVSVVSDSNLVQDTSRWRACFEELPKTTVKPLLSSVEAPKFDLDKASLLQKL